MEAQLQIRLREPHSAVNTELMDCCVYRGDAVGFPTALPRVRVVFPFLGKMLIMHNISHFYCKVQEVWRVQQAIIFVA